LDGIAKFSRKSFVYPSNAAHMLRRHRAGVVAKYLELGAEMMRPHRLPSVTAADWGTVFQRVRNHFCRSKIDGGGYHDHHVGFLAVVWFWAALEHGSTIPLAEPPSRAVIFVFATGTNARRRDNSFGTR
jgi:hypothetical protein